MSTPSTEARAAYLVELVFNFPREVFESRLKQLITTELISLGRSAVGAIVAKLKEEPHASGWRTAALAEVLGRLGARDGVPALLQVLERGNTEGLVAAAKVIGELDAIEAVPALCDMLERVFSRTVRPSEFPFIGSISGALCELASSDQTSVLGRTLLQVERLGFNCDSGTWDQAPHEVGQGTIWLLTHTLGRVGDAEAVPFLLQSKGFKLPVNALRQIGLPAVPALIDALRIDSQLDRSRALCGLVAIGDQALPGIRSGFASYDIFQHTLCGLALACLEGETDATRSSISKIFERSATGIPAGRLLARQETVAHLPSLRSTLPDVKKLCRILSIPREVRNELREAKDVIERDTAHLRSLPVASSELAPSSGAFPLPSSQSEASVRDFPRPSAGMNTAGQT